MYASIRGSAEPHWVVPNNTAPHVALRHVWYLSPDMSIAAVVLAAGASSRYGTDPPKQAVYLAAVLAALGVSAIDEIVVVSGAHPLAVASVHAPDWELGLGTSLRAGLAALGGDVEAAVVVLADGPDLDPRAVDRVIADWRANRSDIVAATYAGVRLHPVLLARAAWASIPDEGARSLPARLVSCDDLTPPGDVDFPATVAGDGSRRAKPGSADA